MALEQGLKEAMKWINGELQDKSGVNVHHLIDKASQRFSLTPLQTEFLYREYARKGDQLSPE